MCLILNKFENNFIAEKNIECYKILEISESLEIKKSIYGWLKSDSFLKFSTIKVEVYQTAIQKTDIELGKQYTSEFTFDFLPISKYNRNISRCKTVEKGLHSFEKLEDAKSHLRSYLNDLSKNFVIVKCIIPAKSTYYKGIFNNYNSYASDRLKYTKEIVYDTTETHKEINKIFDDFLKTKN